MTAAMRCPDRESMLHVLNGSGPPEGIDQLAVHLETCAGCGSTFDALVQNDASAIALHSSPRLDSSSASTIQKLQLRLAKIRPVVPSYKSAVTLEKNSVPGVAPVPPAALPIGSSNARISFLAPALLPDEIGRLGHYRILKKLGAGGMGMVFLAEDTQLRRKVALKTMLPNLAASPQARERFLREARAAAALEHVNVVAIHQVGEDNGVPYLAMPFLKGESLEDRLKRLGKLASFEAARIAVEMAEGLAAAHAEGLIHRDIKPGNVWLEGERGQVKLLDFGLARVAGDTTHLTHSGVIVGTPAFMAPEQARCEAVDSRADLFSLGCTLYVMLSGKQPFKGATLMSLLTALSLDTPIAPHLLNPELPVALSELTMRLLAKKPADRPVSAKEVAEELRRIVCAEVQAGQAKTGGLATVPPLTTSKKIGTPPTRRRRSSVLVGTALFLALAVVAGIIVIIRDKSGKKVAEVSVSDGGVVIADDGKNKAKSEAPRVLLPSPKVEEAWLKMVAALPAEYQVKAVTAKLKERNPGFDGKEEAWKIEDGLVTGIRFSANSVTDIAPVRAMVDLKVLTCHSGQLSDLSPLKGMKLTSLSCYATQVSDLSPLKDMKLTKLWCQGTKVTELSPLKDMKLTFLDCSGTKVTDLSPLRGMPLKELVCDFKPERDAEILRSIKTLETINGKLAAAFWKEVDAQKPDWKP